MANQVRVYPVSFASGATSTNSVYVGNAARIYFYHSGTSAFNVGAGNITFHFLGGFTSREATSSVTMFRILSATLQTDISGGVYTFGNALGSIAPTIAGIPNLAIEFGTAVTGSASNTVYFMACSDD